MTYPEQFFRGVAKREWVDEQGRPSAAMFQFIRNERDDGEFLELSINWDDDDGAIIELLDKKNPTGENHFPLAAIMSTSDLDRSLVKSFCKDILSYERDELPDNTYHGNLLLPAELQTNKTEMKMFYGIIATFVVDYVENKHIV